MFWDANFRSILKIRLDGFLVSKFIVREIVRSHFAVQVLSAMSEGEELGSGLRFCDSQSAANYS